ncbi:MAG: ACT domain-containing protein [Blastocatellia bacterium]|nr:ACT domain-containing protein [Blastocatellia bacterium]
MKLKLLLLEESFAICRLALEAEFPQWARRGFFSVTKTEEELSVVCQQELVPEGTSFEGNWKCLKVAGPLDFSLTGILASIAAPLAESKISIFAVSTFATDYILVKEEKLVKTIEVLEMAGHQIVH